MDLMNSLSRMIMTPQLLPVLIRPNVAHDQSTMWRVIAVWGNVIGPCESTTPGRRLARLKRSAYSILWLHGSIQSDQPTDSINLAQHSLLCQDHSQTPYIPDEVHEATGQDDVTPRACLQNTLQDCVHRSLPHLMIRRKICTLETDVPPQESPSIQLQEQLQDQRKTWFSGVKVRTFCWCRPSFPLRQQQSLFFTMYNS